jgi:hypothetical protein
VDDYIKGVLEHLKEFEAELAKRGTTFFGGKLQLYTLYRLQALWENNWVC